LQDPRYDDLDKRVGKLEQDGKDAVESERLLLRLARLHRAALQELKASSEVEAGDTRQRFDTIEQMLSEHSKQLDGIEAKQDAHTDVIKKLVALAESHDKKLDVIVNLLEQKE